MAFGNHTYEEAAALAASKTKELGKRCIVVQAEDGFGNIMPDLYTIAIELKAIKGAEFLQMLKDRQQK